MKVARGALISFKSESRRVSRADPLWSPAAAPCARIAPFCFGGGERLSPAERLKVFILARFGAEAADVVKDKGVNKLGNSGEVLILPGKGGEHEPKSLLGPASWGLMGAGSECGAGCSSPGFCSQGP